jgi:dipeptidyl aminopeptidase/acylaminoacyl peptidase
MSVAPVTDWTFYDSMYTERYMKTLSSNIEGYGISAVSVENGGFDRVKYLLVHGLSDDNVHFQHSAALVWKLTGKGVKHRVQYYTDSDHSIGAHGANRAVYQLLADFVSGMFNVSKVELG